MTTRRCINLCKDAFQYAALKNGDECFCFNEFVKNTVPEEDSLCTAVCAGDQNDICGDDNRLSVYNGRQEEFCEIGLHFG